MPQGSPTVLVCSPDPMAGALVGAAVEVAGGRPLFAREGERPRAALLRHRPAFVLVDCDDERACADEFLGPVMMCDARVVVFSSARSHRDVGGLVARLGVRTVRLPLDAGALERMLEEMPQG